MKFLPPILAMVVSAISTLTAVVFCLGMGANSTAAQIRALKLWMSGFSLLGVAGIVIGIVLLRGGQLGWATGAAISPTVIIAIIFLISVLK